MKERSQYAQSTRDAADELELFAVNCGELYERRQAIQAKIMRHFQAGIVWDDPESYYVVWCHIAVYRYRRELGNCGYRFTPAAIKLAARAIAESDLAELAINDRAFDQDYWNEQMAKPINQEDEPR